MKKYTVIKSFSTTKENKLCINGDVVYGETKSERVGSCHVNNLHLWSKTTRNYLGYTETKNMGEYLKLEE